MLVHVSRYVPVSEIVADQTQQYVTDLESIIDGNEFYLTKLIKSTKQILKINLIMNTILEEKRLILII